MRSPFHSPFVSHRVAGGGGQPTSEASAAAVFLGFGHPLVGVLRQADTAREQLVVVTAVQAGGVVFALGGHGFGLALAVAGVAVQVGLACRLGMLRASRRWLCIDLIVECRSGLRLACVERECQRLCDSRTSERLARSVEDVVKAAVRPVIAPAYAGPLFDVRVIRRVLPELREIVVLLRSDDPALPGVAAVERLLTSATTPFYGCEVEPLRRELWRVRYLLVSGTRERPVGS